MAEQNLLDKVHDLSDLELATLICLVAQEHCIIDTDEESIDELVQELELVCPPSSFFIQLAMYIRMCQKLTPRPDRRKGLRPIPCNSQCL
jgi:hypothetical protein